MAIIRPISGISFLRNKYWFIAIAGTALFFLISYFFPLFNEWPKELETSPAKSINQGLEFFVINFGSQIDYVKQFAFFFIMLPTKIGLQFSVSPYTWGFELTIYHTIFYFVLMTIFTFWGVIKWGNNLAISLVLFSIFLYFGLTNMPWPSLILIY